MKILNKKNCTSCMACYSSCPVNAIEIKKDNKGFYYPEIDMSKCTECGLCNKICPIKNFENISKKIDLMNIHEVYACTINNNETRKKSSSGGIFSALAEYIIESSGYVCGAIYDDKFIVKHIVSNSIDDIKKMRGSKYVQSLIGDCYKQIKLLLDRQILVLFTGTPCQVAGLKSYLNKDFKNLICIDLICTCVNPPYLLTEYAKSIIGPNELNNINLRSKISGWGGHPLGGEFSCKIEWKNRNGGIINFEQQLFQNLFFNGFLNHLWMKDSCENCIYGNSKRFSDITLGDFWGIGNYNPELNDNKGLSFVLLNTEQGKMILKAIKNKLSTFEPVDYDWAINTQPVLNGVGYTKHINTDNFFKYVQNHYSPMELTKDLLGINKVGILTYDYSINYGARLQAWALSEKIKDYGFTPKIINYNPAYRKILNTDTTNLSKFRTEYLATTQACYTEQELKAEIFDCNRIIVGGDQVFRIWQDNIFLNNENTDEQPFLRYYGDFISGEKVLASYGASFGMDCFNGNFETIEECQKLIKRFDRISVREKSGINILKEIFDLDATEVLDPVFLKTVDDYKNIINKKNECTTLQDSYIAYMNLDSLELNPSLEEKLKKKIVNINLNENNQLNTVEQWLNYIMNADFIITDSFHCIAFCIIFHKPFLVVKRDFGGNTRIENLLNKFNLINCFKDALTDITLADLKNNFNWNKIDEILYKERIKSEKYLLEILLLKPSLKFPYFNNKLENIRNKYELEYKKHKMESIVNNLQQQSILQQDQMVKDLKRQLKVILQKDLIKRKYCKYKILSKILFGKKREHYKEKAKLYKEKIDQIRNIMESF